MNDLKEYQKKIKEMAVKKGFVEEVPSVLYHVTTIENILDINEDGLKIGLDGCIYLTDAKDIKK